MTDAGAAVGMDRLPWLDDEPASRAESRLREPKRPRSRGNPGNLAGMAAAGILLVAGLSYWLGMQSGEQAASNRLEAPANISPEANVKLPDARTMPSVPIAQVPEVIPSPTPTVSVPEPSARSASRPDRRTSRARTLKPLDMTNSDLSKTVAEQEEAKTSTKEAASEPAKPSEAKAATPAAAKPLASRDPLKLWPSRVSTGASGRLVQIGAFGSRQQAKLGWRRMKRAYPAVGRLPAVVVESRNSRGKRFYRFQIGTTSQAHSEVLCQRMQTIRFSCAVVGLPWKSKVER